MRKLKRIFYLLVAGVLAVCLAQSVDGNQVKRWVRGITGANDGGDALLVNHWNPLPEDYDPGELVNLYAQERSFQLATSDILLEREAFEAANRMFAQAARDGVEGFILTSGYRSRERQEEIYRATTDGTAAVPGESEHQTGLAFDVTARRDSGGFETTAQHAWLIKNCWEFGFILRYPQDKVDVTGIAWEPWHYRYVGVDIARILRDNGWTLEEYCQKR